MANTNKKTAPVLTLSWCFGYEKGCDCPDCDAREEAEFPSCDCGKSGPHYHGADHYND